MTTNFYTQGGPIHRVVITGMGVVSPIGNTIEAYWNNLKKGVCGIKPIEPSSMVEEVEVKVAGQVTDFDADKYLDRREQRRLDRFSQFAVYASKEAFLDAGIKMEDEDLTRVGVIIGSGIGGIKTIEEENKKLIQKGMKRVSPLFVPMCIVNMAAGNVSIALGAQGVCSTIVTACASGSHSIGEAFRTLKLGINDIIVAGGTEASITPLGIAGFHSLTALSKSKDPLRASIPFDKERDGFVMGEGAGVVVLETLEHAMKRGAKIYAEVVGYGATGDAYHITSPMPGGLGAANAMRAALSEAGIEPNQINYINAHGTGTQYNDSIETEAVKKVFGEKTEIPMSSTKSMTGHLLGAAGGIEAIAIAKSVEEDFVPPTIGYRVKDEACDLNYVPNEGQACKVVYAMSNSLGFGGHNASLIVKKWEEKI